MFDTSGTAGEDVADPCLYHLILNNEKLPVRNQADMIIALLEDRKEIYLEE